MGNAAADLEVAPQRTSAADRTGAQRSAAVFGGVFVAVAAMESANGGYFPNTWGWATAGFAWAAVIALLLRRERIFDRWSFALVGLLAAFAGWTLLSLAWAPSGAPVFEAERALVYATGAAAVLLVARSRDLPLLLGGVLAAVAVVDVSRVHNVPRQDWITEYGESELAMEKLSRQVGTSVGVLRATYVHLVPTDEDWQNIRDFGSVKS